MIRNGYVLCINVRGADGMFLRKEYQGATANLNEAHLFFRGALDTQNMLASEAANDLVPMIYEDGKVRLV